MDQKTQQIAVPKLNPLYITHSRVDGEITLIRYKHPSTKQKEYWTNVLGFPVDEAPDTHWKRAQEAVDSAKAVLPEIRIKVEAIKAQEAEQKEKMLAEIKAKTGDVGPQPDDEIAELHTNNKEIMP